MRMGDYLFNVLLAVIAVDYMDHGFRKRYHGRMRIFSFLAGCGIYFLAVTGFNIVMGYESMMGFLYGVIVVCYGLVALEGKKWAILFYGILWMVIVLIASYAVYGVIGGDTRRKSERYGGVGMEISIFCIHICNSIKIFHGKSCCRYIQKKGDGGQSGGLDDSGSFSADVFLGAWNVPSGTWNFQPEDAVLSVNGNHGRSVWPDSAAGAVPPEAVGIL